MNTFATLRHASRIPSPCLSLEHGSGGTRARGEHACDLGYRLGDGAEGVYAGWRWDGEQLHAWTDRYGFYSLFCAVSGSRIWVSPSIPALLAAGAPADLDYPALGVFLRSFLFLQDATPFRAIRTLPPGGRLVWRNGEATLSGARPRTAPQPLKAEPVIDGYVELFRRSMERCAAAVDDSILFLSGGRDSRHILFELARLNKLPRRCYTILNPNAGPEDVAVAAQVAARLKVPHTALQPVTLWIEAQRETTLRTSFCGPEHAWIHDLVEEISDASHVLYDGIAGDVLSESRFLTRERLDRFEREDWTGMAGDVLGFYQPGLLHPRFQRLIPYEEAEAAVIAELKTHAAAPNPVGSFLFWNRTRRTVARIPFSLLGQHTVFAPYLDSALWDFLASAPASVWLGAHLHTRTIASAFPQYNDIPYAAPDKAGVRSKPYNRSRAYSLLGRLHTAQGVLFQRPKAALSLLRCLASSRHTGDLEWLAPQLSYVCLLEEVIPRGQAVTRSPRRRAEAS